MEPTPANQDSWQPGTVIPGTVYRIVRILGRGGMGEVYEVEHVNLGVKRALKVLLNTYSGREDLTQRLKIEAQGLAKIKHPNLVEVYDLGAAADGRIFFAMEFLDGTNLRHLVRDTGPMRVTSAATVMTQVLDGLAAAHREGMLHRDVKPENIFVCRSGVVKLLDFGVAKAIYASMASKEKITVAGTTVGTPRYMSVEQAEGDEVDGRTDVYSAGLVLWELLVGRPAFEQDDVFDLVDAKRNAGVPSLLSMGLPDVSAELASVVESACAVRPEDRMESAAAFAAALRACTGAPPPSAFLNSAATSHDLSPSVSAASTGKGATQMLVGASAPEQGRGSRWSMSRAIVDDLTQRIDTAVAIDRVGATKTSAGLAPSHYGPAGTKLLPAVRDRAARPRLSAENQSDTTDPARQGTAASQELSGKPFSRGAVLVIAFVAALPIIIAAVVLIKGAISSAVRGDVSSPKASASDSRPPPAMSSGPVTERPVVSSGEPSSRSVASPSATPKSNIERSRRRAPEGSEPNDHGSAAGGPSAKVSLTSRKPASGKPRGHELRAHKAASKPHVRPRKPPRATEPVLPASGL